MGRIQMGSTTNSTVDILYGNEEAISITDTSIIFNKPFNLNIGDYNDGDLLLYNGVGWTGLSKGSTDQVLGITDSGLGWINQTASDYFAPYAQHLSSEEFYTSDYDLSALSSHKYGMGVKYFPFYGVARSRPFLSSQKKEHAPLKNGTPI